MNDHQHVYERVILSEAIRMVHDERGRAQIKTVQYMDRCACGVEDGPHKSEYVLARKVDEELTGTEIDRQDFVDNAVYNLIGALIPGKYRDKEYDWDIEDIGNVREVIGEILEEKLGVTEADFYPFIEMDDEEVGDS